jgi:hypothetical protein
MPFGKISHVHMKKYLDDNNYNYFIPKEKLLMYVRENGDNISDGYIDNLYKKIRKLVAMVVRIKILDKDERRKFGIT